MSDIYQPRRDQRFEYVFEAMEFIEQRQCGSCFFAREDDPTYPMCMTAAEKLFDLQPVEFIVGDGYAGIRCTKYQTEA